MGLIKWPQTKRGKEARSDFAVLNQKTREVEEVFNERCIPTGLRVPQRGFAPSAEDVVLNSEDSLVLELAKNSRLSPRQRQAIIVAVEHDCQTQTEVAKILKISPSEVSQLFASAARRIALTAKRQGYRD